MKAFRQTDSQYHTMPDICHRASLPLRHDRHE